MSNPPPPLDAILRAALAAADPAEAVRRHVARRGDALIIDGEPVPIVGRDIRLFAAGKAAVPMATALLGLLEGCAPRGALVTKYAHLPADAHFPFEVIEAGHPLPDANSLRAGDAVCNALAGCNPDTLVLVCVSGGASALLVAPHAGISLRTVTAINDALLKSGADIVEMNAVRSRIDRLKAGGLVRLAQPADVHGLILSDVIGDPLNVIASGLTHDPAARNVLVGNNTQACEAALHAARAQGYAARIVTTELRGEAREQGAQIASQIAAQPPGTVLIYGGETTVTLTGDGKGGRNQELALAAALHGLPAGCGAAALGTDGTDGPTDAAGAWADGATILRAQALGLDAAVFLARNASYEFFAQVGGLLMTGPTGTNVADVIVAMRGTA
jgi:glycerate 2-kinase